MTQGLPVIRIRIRPAEHVANGRITSLLLHHGTFPWAADLSPGSEFAVTAASPHVRDSVVQVERVCQHQPLQAVTDCPESHDPTAVSPGRTGWYRIFDNALLLGETDNRVTDVLLRKREEAWTVVDFAVVHVAVN